MNSAFPEPEAARDQKGDVIRQTGKLLWMQCFVRAVETGSRLFSKSCTRSRIVPP